ncbi:RNA-binding S4 domain-containing protein [Rhizobium sp.]|jgi:ribosome-associated heat shock protein Hsp15|uniref:RNA-binding S4 domain-containing protein n=1 Tax=Rhizobium sp. TaxID=391 RepID=UPI000E8B1F4F|nr:RNA-binding protein [Rhizobium sp.]
MDDQQPLTGAPQRIDKWLFFARMSKSRTLAQTLISSGHIAINGQKAKQPSTSVRAGDRVEIKQHNRDIVLIVRKPGERRGPYEEARLLYEDISPPPDPGDQFTNPTAARREPGSGRPTKRDRRLLDRLMDSDD